MIYNKLYTQKECTGNSKEDKEQTSLKIFSPYKQSKTVDEKKFEKLFYLV